MSTYTRVSGFFITVVLALLPISPDLVRCQAVAGPEQQMSRPWNNRSLAPERRANLLIKQMTLDEKIAMIHGTGEDASTYQGQAGYLPGIKRLGIPPMRFADGPPGV